MTILRRHWHWFAGPALLVVAVLSAFVCRVEVTEVRDQRITRHEVRYGMIWSDRSVEEPPWSTTPALNYPVHFNTLKVRRTWAYGLIDDTWSFWDTFSPSIKP